MKKTSLFLALLLALLLLAGCGQRHEHVWKDASCTEPETCELCGETRGASLDHLWRSADCSAPETCARCGETRGEPLDHDWKPADCTTPETCARCGQTQGEPLGHIWKAADCTAPETCTRCGQTRGVPLGHDAGPADYWTASVCSRCGEEIAPALTPDFVAHGLEKHLIEEGKTYDYRTVCYKDKSRFTVGSASLVSYQSFEKTTTLEDGIELPARDGYVWLVATFEVWFNDQNAQDYGITTAHTLEDYYDVCGHDDTLRYNAETGIERFDIVWKGKTYEGLLVDEGWFGEWTAEGCLYVVTFYARVPEGYDGMVVGLRNAGVDWYEGQYIFDLDNSDTLFFRMS